MPATAKPAHRPAATIGRASVRSGAAPGTSADEAPPSRSSTAARPLSAMAPRLQRGSSRAISAGLTAPPISTPIEHWARAVAPSSSIR